jgi:hypothetical protein
MSNMPADREDLRAHVRDEAPPTDAVAVLRGGADSLTKLEGHSRRTNAAYCLDGQPVWGVSVFAALDDIGPASLDGLLAARLGSYRLVQMPTVSELAAAGFEFLLPTFGRPHFTLLLSSNSELELRKLLKALGSPQHNPYHGPRSRRR